MVENAEQLASSVHGTSEISERVSYKVRELNTAQSRIDSTLKRINIVVSRSSAVDGIRSALEVGDFELAAEHVRKYLELEKRFGKVTDEVDSRQLQEQHRVRSLCVAELLSGPSVLCAASFRLPRDRVQSVRCRIMGNKAWAHAGVGRCQGAAAA